MTPFRDQAAAARTMERLATLIGRRIEPFVDAAFVDCPHPDLALVHLERWLKALSNPGAFFDHLESNPAPARLLVALLGSSHQMADLLAQNPELANLVLDPHELSRRPTVEGVRREAVRLLTGSISYSHSLDRLRFLKQKWLVVVAVNDLAGLWEPAAVWAALSDLAEAILGSLAGVVWRNYVSERGLDEPCPVSIVAMGKQGGRELNYSSDVDLIFILPDGVGDDVERHAGRFCEAYSRALADRMGRGSLYRVDLRLRPFGASGRIVTPIGAAESYYERYAEPWEHLALIRSKVVVSTGDIAERWAALRTNSVFREVRGEWAVEGLLAMRSRLEEKGGERDLKRGPGGVRDVEFATQILQMLNGKRHPELQEPGTIGALERLGALGLISQQAAHELIEGYTFLRQVEHRCQLVGDLQTHSLPEKIDDREFLARRMGYPSAASFESTLELHRGRIRQWYRELTRRESAEVAEDALDFTEAFGPLAPAAHAWMDSMPEPEAFSKSVLENEGSVQRIRRVLSDAPALAQHLRSTVSVTEQIITGEVQEREDPSSRFQSLGPAADASDLALAVKRGWIRLAARWTLDPEIEFGQEFAALLDAAFRAILDRHQCEFDVIALGSYSMGELGLFSDADLMLLVPDAEKHSQAEAKAQEFLAAVQVLRQTGSPIQVDLRLRPEGRKGMLVSSYDAFVRYEAEAMEMWERFALASSRQIVGSPQALELVRDATFHSPLDDEGLNALLSMKKRIENERVSPQYRRRHVKLGDGGLDDIQWLVTLNLMRRPGEARALGSVRLDDRLRALAHWDVINAVERDAALAARAFLAQTRIRLALLGFADDVVPENPDKLDRLAAGFELKDGNAFLRQFESHCQAVRSIYEESVERLRS